MALFGGHRDISLFRHLNRELLHDIITQQVAFYKHKLADTKVNMYGEAVGEKYYIGPVLFNCIIERKDKRSFDTDTGIDTGQNVDFKLLRDDLVDGNYVPEIGDIVLYEEGYFEVHNIIENQYHSGKNPDYPNNSDNSANPLNPNLDLFGYNVSLICECHSIPSDRPAISVERLR